MDIKNIIKENVPLAPLTTFKIGGPAKFFVEPVTKEELMAAAAWANGKKEKLRIFGGGSNLLVNDAGVNGLVIKLKNDQASVHGQRLEAGAGVSLSTAAHVAKSGNLSGLEWTVGIPNATIGGSIRGNAEAFGTSMADLVETVQVFSLENNSFTVFSNKECAFGYRQSVFKQDRRLVVWQAVLKLAKASGEQIEKLTAQSIEFRSSRYPKLPSAGSVFENVPFAKIREANARLAEELAEAGKLREGNIGAGKLIDLCGLKGKTIGGAKISLEHANHIVNTGKATADDVATLVSLVKQQVRDKFGVELHEEIEYFGFD